MMPTPRNDVITRRCGIGIEERGQGADVVEVGVGEPDPAQLARIDHRRQRRHELGGAGDGAGVDEDGLAAVQHERVDGERAEGGDVGGRRDHVDAGGGREAGGHDRASLVGLGGSWCAAVLGLGRRLEALEGGAHALEQLLVAVGGHVEDAGPRRDPPHLVALGDPGAAVAQGLEPVAPHGGLPAALVGDEGELAARIGDQHPAVARVADAPPGSHRVVPDEGGALHGDGDVALPVDALALRAPLPDAGQVGDHRVERVGAGFDVELDVVGGQPPTLVLRCHRSVLLSW